LPIENYVLDYFVIPSLLSGQRLPLSCHSFALLRTASEGAQATEESSQETLRLRLRVTSKKKGDRKGVFLTLSEAKNLIRLFVILNGAQAE
jgi:hypothetical protein